MAHNDLDTDKVILNSRYLPSEIRQKPAINMTEQAALAGIPVSTLEKIYSEEGGPRLFMLGRHRKALVEDFMGWLKQRADSHPYVRQPARNPYGRNGKDTTIK